jgi:hypothetical protein
MLTTATTGVDGPLSGPPRAVMWTVKAIADRDRVSKQAVSKHVQRLVASHGLAVERDGSGRISAVNVAEYDHLRGRYGDPSKAQAPRRVDPAPEAVADGAEPPANESYDEALRVKTWHEVEKRRIELDELKGDLVRKATVVDAARRFGEVTVRVIDRLPNATDELAAAMVSEGSHGLRVALRKLAGRLRAEIVRDIEAEMRAAATGPEAEEPE